MRKIILGISGAVIIVFIFSFLYFLPQKKEPQPSTSLTKGLIKEAETVLAEGNFLKAKEIFKQVLERLNDPQEIEKIKKKIEDINLKILFSPVIDSCSREYIVKPKDTLIKIAKKFGTTVALIKKANRLKSDIIRPDQKLKVNTCPFTIVIDKSQNLLFLKRNEEIVKTYLVATGKDNSTPTGTFKIVNKLKNPTWFKTGAVIPPDSPQNILGSRWLGFDIKGYGIHGTTSPEDLGKQITMGCIRMRDKDVEELYDIVPRGTKVVIVN